MILVKRCEAWWWSDSRILEIEIFIPSRCTWLIQIDKHSQKLAFACRIGCLIIANEFRRLMVQALEKAKCWCYLTYTEQRDIHHIVRCRKQEKLHVAGKSNDRQRTISERTKELSAGGSVRGGTLLFKCFNSLWVRIKSTFVCNSKQIDKWWFEKLLVENIDNIYNFSFTHEARTDEQVVYRRTQPSKMGSSGVIIVLCQGWTKAFCSMIENAYHWATSKMLSVSRTLKWF